MLLLDVMPFLFQLAVGSYWVFCLEMLWQSCSKPRPPSIALSGVFVLSGFSLRLLAGTLQILPLDFVFFFLHTCTDMDTKAFSHLPRPLLACPPYDEYSSLNASYSCSAGLKINQRTWEYQIEAKYPLKYPTYCLQVSNVSDLPKDCTFMLCAKPAPILCEWPILSGVEVVWVSQYTLVCGDGDLVVIWK